MNGKGDARHDVTLTDILEARQRIGPMVVRTPLLPSLPLTRLAGRSVCLKAESLQRTGSFKIRGAANKILSLTVEERARGVITVSSGNHGLAVSSVAGELGVHAVICMSTRVPVNKVAAIKRLGAETVVEGNSYEEAERHARNLSADRGLTMVPPFDDPLIIAGQGTIGLEILEDDPGVGTVIVPLSGGGLISGIAVSIKTTKPAIRVIGVSMNRAPVMYRSLEAGVPVDLPEEPTLADALVGGIGLNNHYTFRMVREHADGVVLVSEEEIADAMTFALDRHHLVTEGGGAVGIAAVLQRRVGKLGGNVAVVVSGSNVDRTMLLKVASGNRHEAP